MSKDDRIVVRMSAELRGWVHAEASAREMDDAAYVRMVLAEAKSGVAAARIQAQAPRVMVPAPPIRRDVLDVSSMGDAPPEPVTSIAEDSQQPAASAFAEATGDKPSVDVDALVADTFSEAEAQGLTEPQIEAANGEPPPAGVRSLFRRPTPFSPGGSQLARIEQYLASN